MPSARILLPVFARILLGWGRKRRVEPSGAFRRGLKRLIHPVFFPAMQFHSLSRVVIDLDAARSMLAGGIAYTPAGMGLGYASKWLWRAPPLVFASAIPCSYRFNSHGVWRGVEANAAGALDRRKSGPVAAIQRVENSRAAV